jgi:hypothetical protein
MIPMKARRPLLFWLPSLAVGVVRARLQHGDYPWAVGAMSVVTHWLAAATALGLVILAVYVAMSAWLRPWLYPDDPKRGVREESRQAAEYVSLVALVASLLVWWLIEKPPSVDDD